MKLALISLGCPKNQVDADVMCHDLIACGYTTVADINEADVIIVNTCGFIESAKTEAIENILIACQCKVQNPNVKVIVTGCLAERYQSEIKAEIPEVDAIVGIGSNGAIAAIVYRVCGGEELESYGAKSDMPLGGKRVISTPRHYAYLKIAEGCSNRCHYCAIPLIRGGLRSRSVEDVIGEARFLANEGVRELIIVAQDITAFGDDRNNNEIGTLLDQLNAIDGIEWIRLLYAYPERITDEFINAMVRNNKVLHYLDVPIQHANDEILKAMNRKGTKATVLSAITRLRAAMPDITLRTTLIAGYPGETDAHFDELCTFVKDQQFDRLGCFAFSEEEGTVAATMPNPVDIHTRTMRADAIMRIQTDIMAKKQEGKIGTILKAICDGFDDENDLYTLRSMGDSPEIDAECYANSDVPLEPGKIYTLRIIESDVYDLYGEIVGE